MTQLNYRLQRAVIRIRMPVGLICTLHVQKACMFSHPKSVSYMYTESMHVFASQVSMLHVLKVCMFLHSKSACHMF